MLRMFKGKISAGQVIIPLAEKISTQICAAVAFKNNLNRSIRGCSSAERRGVGLGIYGTAEVFEARKYWETTDRQRVNPIEVMDGAAPSSSRRLSLLYPESLRWSPCFFFRPCRVLLRLLNGGDHHQQRASALGYPGWPIGSPDQMFLCPHSHGEAAGAGRFPRITRLYSGAYIPR